MTRHYRGLCLIILSICATALTAQAWEITELAPLPEAISNNAVEGAVVDGEVYLYSFAGIDSTKRSSGIHLRSYRYIVSEDRWEQISSLPDNQGKIAAAANRIGDIIYIVGGYYVFGNGAELTSNLVHRFNVRTNEYMSNAPVLLRGTDDQVQAVWRDSVLYAITGWNNVTNIRDVQIYFPERNLWTNGTPVPNNNIYKSFGASGTIIGDTIFYFGGASLGGAFPIQNEWRRGIINPESPSEIAWSDGTFNPNQVGYRMASTSIGDTACWIGGSETTYNFNGIAYNGSGGVPPSGKTICYVPQTGELLIDQDDRIPMDLRGIVNFGDSLFYLIGGMEADQKVSKKLLRLRWKGDFTTSIASVSPKPAPEILIRREANCVHLSWRSAEPTASISLLNVSGQQVLHINGYSPDRCIDLSQLAEGQYFVLIRTQDWQIAKPIAKS